AVDALKGEPGTNVTVLIRRGGTEKSLTITRRKVEVPSVYYRTIEKTGYVRIKEFNDNTPAQFDRAIERLTAEKVEALIFDLRGNPGGTMEGVAQILDTLLPEGPIVSATYKDSEPKVLHTSDAEEIDLPMVVLTNEKTASAAELFAQALKDYNKAKTVGTVTYGKGVMQTIYPLNDGSALDITVAYYNPPFSENFNGVGVKPDYEVKISAELEQELDRLDEYSDPQLKKAMEVVGATLKNNPGYVAPPVDTSSSAPEKPASAMLTPFTIDEGTLDKDGVRLAYAQPAGGSSGAAAAAISARIREVLSELPAQFKMNKKGATLELIDSVTQNDGKIFSVSYQVTFDSDSEQWADRFAFGLTFDAATGEQISLDSVMSAGEMARRMLDEDRTVLLENDEQLAAAQQKLLVKLGEEGLIEEISAAGAQDTVSVLMDCSFYLEEGHLVVLLSVNHADGDFVGVKIPYEAGV
ncbi:MAG: S41 family peptidase, partial [Oscillospiraceae bacterium]